VSTVFGNAALRDMSVGDFEISLIRDSVYWWDGGVYFGVVPKTLWSKKVAPDELNRVPLAFNCYLIRTGGHTILIETGGGDKMDARFRERAKMPPQPEPLASVIARQSFDPESIDIVVNSHLHWDHCGGNTTLAGGRATPSFPRAHYFAPRAEWEHAHERHIRDSVSYIDANYDPLVESGQMTLVESDFEIAPGVWMRGAPGHTRGLMAITATSGGKTFCFFSDMVPSSAHTQPTWVPAFDLFPLESIDTRIRWLSEAVNGQWICGFAHDSDLSFARIASDPKTRFRAIPA
jgi:glyoxylase-like metal-dependent hydrolase (beta-lactamase superfamily II)